MSNPFSINIVTPDGAALIAQATAANQIVFTAALSGTTAATDAADLASKTAAFYDGASGTIDGCSAANSVAKIVARFGNTGGAAQIVKSVCIVGKLASQADADAVIVAAMSDDNSEVVLPSSASPTQIIRFPFNININVSGSVSTVYSDGATLSDLQRFVSMYKAGDPTTGENQTILGDKTFSGDTSFNTIGVASTATFSGNVTFSAITPVVTVSSTANTAFCEIHNDQIVFYDTYSQLAVNIHANGNAEFIGKLTVDGDIKADGTNKVAEFYNCDVEGELSVAALTGTAPGFNNSVFNVPIGGIVLAYDHNWNNQGYLAGTQITVAANTVYTVPVDGSVNTGSYLPAGEYVFLSDSWNGISNSRALLQRIS